MKIIHFEAESRNNYNFDYYQQVGEQPRTRTHQLREMVLSRIMVLSSGRTPHKNTWLSFCFDFTVINQVSTTFRYHLELQPLVRLIDQQVAR
jgi:hypothetical protein